ncbi:hypothetical protein DW718_00640 [Weissella cibaria]|nr:hypothetical protein DW718_00640 [Weissella cibaria]RHE79501.1 hypothetical protein DW717_00640 [Weissella cibaria]
MTHMEKALKLAKLIGKYVGLFLVYVFVDLVVFYSFDALIEWVLPPEKSTNKSQQTLFLAVQSGLGNSHFWHLFFIWLITLVIVIVGLRILQFAFKETSKPFVVKDGPIFLNIVIVSMLVLLVLPKDAADSFSTYASLIILSITIDNYIRMRIHEHKSTIHEHKSTIHAMHHKTPLRYKSRR